MIRDVLMVFGCLFAVGAISAAVIVVFGLAGILLTNDRLDEMD